ncbi:ABC transporter substrate-binding protein [Neiella marina]|uniref:ABC transporter substrate-binding protein n=1 Tax=Neiella holothuriorum TaxID=2870530 RepID=A0ABS7EFI0_9GAMM|nr:CmpA/NrtA family ABC transporter substrate-binding protein [Neiella holothuriorum]MBW8190541.1 ABC transporter substrate-binding protein [Neiella holothuriorum]
MSNNDKIKIGFVRLTDSAPLIVAEQLGLYKQHGLDVELQRERSWAAIRDKLHANVIQGAQLLAPLAIAIHGGLMGPAMAMDMSLSLGCNGNAISMSSRCCAQIRAVGGELGGNPMVNAQSFGEWVRQRRQSIKLATVHPYSVHTFQLHAWLRYAGLNPTQDVDIVTLPPEQMVDSLMNGHIDGFCVGSPWSSVAVQKGVAEIMAAGCQLWSQTPEKVLAMPKLWVEQNAEQYDQLLAAVLGACAWLGEPANQDKAIAMLAKPEYLDLPPAALKPAISGELVLNRLGEQVYVPNYHEFYGRLANQLSEIQQQWLLTHMNDCVAEHNMTLEDIRSCFNGQTMSRAEQLAGVALPEVAGHKMPALVTLA